MPHALLRTILLLQVLLVATAAAGGHRSARGGAAVTILEPATAVVRIPTGVVLLRQETRLVAMAASPDPRSGAWLEVRSGEAEQGIAVTVDRGGSLHLTSTASPTAAVAGVPVSITYHQF